MNQNVEALGIGGKLKRFAATNQIGMALVFSVLLFFTNVIISPRSLNINAFGSILALTIMLTISAAGQTIVIVSGGIDLSVGAVMSLTGLMTVQIMRGNEGYFLVTLLMSMGFGAAAGLLNGVGVALVRLPPMIVTMCVANVFTRLQYVLTEGKPSGTASPWFTRSMNYRIGGVVPYSIFYGIVIFALVIFILNRSRYGMRLFLTGNNERAAYLTGIRTVRVKMMAYVIAGVFAGVAGFLGAGYINFVRGNT
ncbi:MAG: ABC transporter permease, partial [Treponema sp.]|nr:ABC transporter permease [Treponema sp.]